LATHRTGLGEAWLMFLRHHQREDMAKINTSTARIEVAIAATASTYHQVLDLVQEVEAQVVGETASKNRWFAFLQRVLWLPAMFVVTGIQHKLKAFFSWAFLTAAFLLAESALLSAGLQIDQPFRGALDWICVLCPVLLVMFPMPSVHIASGVSPEDVGFAIERMVDAGIDSKDKVSAIQQTSKVFEDRCKRRVVSLTWLVGLAWAGWTYFFVKGLEGTIAGHPPTPGNLIASIIAFYCVLALYLVVTGYESALDRVFRTIDVAGSEITLQVESARAQQSSDAPQGSSVAQAMQSAAPALQH
jgi:hypothetical protein